MYIVERTSQVRKEVVIQKIGKADLKRLTVNRYSFDWKELAQVYELYKLMLASDDDILGVMAIERYPEEQRLEIKLLAVSSENVGKHKQYERIAGCLIAYACREAVKSYSPFACVSLIPKTQLKTYYMEKYNMFNAGKALFLEDEALLALLKEYIL